VVVSNSRRFGAYFFLSAVVLILAFLVYTQVFVVRPARQVARQMIEFYAFSYKLATQDTIVVAESGGDLTTIFEMIKDSEFPVVITDTDGIPQYWKGISVSPDNPSEETIQRVRSTVSRLDQQNPPLRMTIPYIGDRILHYGDSSLVSRLYWLPWLALAATGLFIGVGYAGFRHIKNSEQRALWVGMARETAHQLGTPLSSLSGWTELLKDQIQTTEEEGNQKLVDRLEQITVEMEQDTSRLNKIASRFSQIGSIPELRMGKVGDVVMETATYLKRRLPSEVSFEYLPGPTPPVPMNRELLGWALENLFKNAADAIEGRSGGRIEVTTKVREEGEWVDMSIRDNGKGIAPNALKQVFIPGYSTKKRGWGLGLAFVKRIVEDYHNGRISIQESAPGKGTTFLICLPTPKHSKAEP
tara:strand:+ start:4150 stop:5391 length:1242 start_codon:yes stop_codon:yes gene_type:complete